MADSDSTAETPAGTPADGAPSKFEAAAAGDDVGLLREMGAFLAETKKWWLLPILVALLLIGLLVVLGATGLAPFIYPLF